MIASGRMLGKTVFLSGGSGRVQLVAGDLPHVGAVNDEFLLRNAYRQQFSNALPRHGIEVLPVRHVPFTVHRSVEDLGGVVRPRGQAQQVRFFFLVQIDGPAFGFLMDAYVGGVGEPVGRGLIQVLQ